MTEQFGFNTYIGEQKVFVQLNPFDKEVIQKYCAMLEKPNCYVEIGTDEGGSALVAKGATDVDIYTIDKDKKYRFEDPAINFITKPSVEVAETWNKPVGVLFIDGDHNQVKADFNAWEKHVVSGGYILFHDYIKESSFTVIEDCDGLFNDNDNYEIVYKPDNSTETIENTRCLIVKKK